MLDTLCVYLPLFENWRNLYPHESFTHLGDKVRAACREFVGFTVHAIRFLRRNAACECMYYQSYRKHGGTRKARHMTRKLPNLQADAR